VTEAPTVAVVGGGQLARMMQQAAIGLGVRLRCLVEARDSSAAQVIPDAPVGAAADEAAVRRLVAGAQVLTFEHEHVPNHLLRDLAAEGVPVHPAADALVHAQDKIAMRRHLTVLGVPCPDWAEVTTADELAEFGARVGWPLVVKRAKGGYDGKGVRVVREPAEAADWLDHHDGIGVLAEALVPFTRELAVLVARRPSGELRTWPVVETVQRGGICAEVVAPAPGLDPALADEAVRVATAIASGLGVTGVLAVEMFQEPAHDGAPARVVVNELAMRPHNSGHWTIDGAVTSQFEQHLRAVLDLPLGDTSPVADWSVMINLLGSELENPAEAYPEVFRQCPRARVHLYGKSVRPGRKLGHVTVYGPDLEAARDEASRAVALLGGRHPGPDGDR
jgi:5-(carboxyamino)imidazole ribonucleotide synthase